MANAGASIEAVLSLNATSFNQGITSSIEALSTFEKSIGTFRKNTSSFDSALRNLQSSLQVLVNEINLFNIESKKLADFSKFATSVNKVSNALRTLSSSEIDAVQSMNLINNMFRAFQGSLNGVEVKVKGVSTVVKELASSENQSASATQQVATATQQYDKALELALPPTRNLITSTRELANSQNQLQSEERETASATEQATNSMNRQASATNRLGKAMSSLRMMGTMVASMMVYNFAHSLITATRETVNAKSEMNGYFQMLGYTNREVADFNAELDKTVQKFPRLNKYALGETISSIGVEFELTTAEMKKAMPVVSMITSEYLRAGRNVNEASLAVKDILQGEFQRLSRETGVKGDQLKATGLWSGDKTDVMGLLKALEKVGKDRNWDIFVTKANSLNDAVLILQNRFSEWSADMVERVQPIIVGVFNMLLGTAQKFAGAFNTALNWLSGDGIPQSVVKWGGLATVLGTVTTALIHYRTGANLTQIAQMGLTKSIGASILGLEAETVAESGLRNAIVQTITGLEAETIAEDLNVSQRRARIFAITSTITGLEAEEVAQIGVTKSLLASLFGLDMATLKEYGFSVALAKSTTQMEAQKLASMSLAKRIALIGATTIPAIAVVGAFAVAFGTLALQMNDSAKQMEKFNKLVNEGQDIIKENKAIVDDYTQRQENLSKTLQETERGTVEYYNAQKELMSVNDSLIVANQNYENSVKAVEVAVSSQKHYEERLTEISIEKQGRLAEAYMDAGYSMREAYEMANDSLIDANNGAEQLRITLQKIAQLSYKGEQNTAYLLKQFEENGVDKEEGKKYLTEAERLNAQAQKSLEKGMTDESFMGRMDGWLGYYTSQIQIWLNNVGAMVETNDWGAIWDNVWKGIAHGFADLPIFKDFWGWVYGQLGVNKYKGQGWDAFGNIFNDAINGLFGSIFGANNDNSLQAQFGKWMSDSVNSIDIMGMLNDIFLPFGDIDLWDVLSNIGFLSPVSASDGSSDHPSFMDDLSDILGFDVQQWITNFQSDPLGTLGIDLGGFNIGTLIKGILGVGSAESGDDPLGGYLNTVMTNLGNGIIDKIRDIPIVGSIAEMLGLVPSENENAYQTGYNLIDNLKRGVEQKISEIPIVGDIAQMLGLIPSQNSNANAKGEGIGSNIKDGEKAGHQGTADNVRTEMDNIISAMSQKAGSVYSTAMDIGGRILNGIKDSMGMHSPSIISRELMPNEFGVYIPQAITDASATAYESAYMYGQQIRDGISATNFNTIGFDSAVGEYEDDAQMIADSSYLMGTTTTTAFNDMTMSVNASTNQMQTNVVGTYSQIQTKQASSLNSMKTQNIQAYNDMYLKSNQSLIQMRDSTTNVTHQMTQAWTHMKDQIVSTANRLKTDSTNHFNQLSNTIGTFYGKIQNPSRWGAGTGSSNNVRTARNPIGRNIARTFTRHGAGSRGDKYRGASTMTVAQAKKMFCPNGDCANIFDGYSLSDTIDIREFLANISGEHGFGWNGWNVPHYNHIKTKSDAWSMKSPMINLAGGIPTNANFKVGEFNNGTPKVSFSTFQSIAGSIFSAIPYKHYMDSSWKGSWLGALQSGACNCSDGADALIALASVFGFGGSKQWGTWDGEGHFWAVINGVPMDTTAWQKGYGWTSPKVHGYGSPARSGSNDSGKTVNVTVDMQGATIYGVDDLDSRIQESVQKGLQAEFNDPYTITI